MKMYAIVDQPRAGEFVGAVATFECLEFECACGGNPHRHNGAGDWDIARCLPGTGSNAGLITRSRTIDAASAAGFEFFEN